MQQREALANPAEVTKRLLRLVSTGELTTLLQQEPRELLPTPSHARRLSSREVDQLVVDYRTVQSTYELASRYGIHRNTVAAHLKSRGVMVGHEALSEAEVARARELHGQGLSLNGIGRAMGRDPKTVKNALV